MGIDIGGVRFVRNDFDKMHFNWLCIYFNIINCSNESFNRFMESVDYD